MFADRITTVSPSYARELLTPGYQFAFGFDGILASRDDRFTGILNGIDTEAWDPANDPFLPAPFSADALEGKREAKRALLEAAGLPSDKDALSRPAIGMLSRLTHQKGFDLLAEASDALLRMDASWILLGDGDRRNEEFWASLASRHPD